LKLIGTNGMKKKIAFYLGNKNHPSIDFSHPEQGNPGVGYSDYLPVALVHYLTNRYGDDYEYYLLAEEVSNLPTNILHFRVLDINDAAQKAADINADIFVFRTRINEEDRILSTIDRLNLKSIGIAQLTPTPKHIKKLAKSKSLMALVCVGKEQYDFLIDTKLSNKLTVINNAIDTSLYKPLDKAERNTKLVTYMGALTTQKGFHVLAEAWPSILEQHPDAKLSVIGSTKLYDDKSNLGRFGVSDKEYEQKYITRYLTDKRGDLLKSVTLHGQMGIDKLDILRKSIIGVANPTGDTETCCVSAVEMSASGIAVVSGAFYALLNTVKHKQTGLLGDTTKDLVKNICSLLDNPVMAIKLGVNGQKYAQNEFSFDQILPQWMNLFDVVLGNKKIPTPSGYKNLLKHLKFLRIINMIFQRSFGRYMFWPSIYETQWLLKDLYLKIKKRKNK